jgi:hypothetical protein
VAFIALTEGEIAPDQPVSNDLLTKVKNNFDDHEARIGAGGGSGSSGSIGSILNGSLEVDSDVNGVPDNFTRYLYAGGSAARDITDSVHGKYSYRFVHPGGVGNGGGYLETDYISISHLYHPDLPFAFKKSAAGTRVEIVARFYSQNALGDPSTYIGEKVLWTTTGVPYPRWTGANITKITHQFPTARWVKYRFIGGKNDVNAAGSVWFDALGAPLLVPTRVPLSNGISQGQVALYSTYPGGWVQQGTTWTVDIPNASFRYLKVGVVGRGGYYDDGSFFNPIIRYPMQVRFTLGSGANMVTSQQVDFDYTDPGNVTQLCVCDISTLAAGSFPLRFYCNFNPTYHELTAYQLGYFSSVDLLKYFVGAQVVVDVSEGTVTEIQG